MLCPQILMIPRLCSQKPVAGGLAKAVKTGGTGVAEEQGFAMQCQSHRPLPGDTPAAAAVVVLLRLLYYM